MEIPPTPGKTSCGDYKLAIKDSMPAEDNSPWTTMASDSCIVSKTSTSSGSAFGCVLMVLPSSGNKLLWQKRQVGLPFQENWAVVQFGNNSDRHPESPSMSARFLQRANRGEGPCVS